MPDLAARIQALSEQFIQRLNDLHDDFDITKSLWTEKLIRVRAGEKIAIKSTTTGTVTDGVLLAARARDSSERLKIRSFKDIVAQVELFVAELLKAWLPENVSLIQEKALSVAILFRCTTLDAARAQAVAEAVEDTILKKLFGKPAEWFNYLRRNLNAKYVPADEAAFIELKARRDVLEHQNGTVESTYLEKAKNSAKYKIGDLIQLADSDIDDAYHLTRRLIENFATSIIAEIGKAKGVSP